MKKILILCLLSLAVISCEKDYYLIPADEVPKWLKTRIAEDEKKIETNPMSGLDVAAWIRYKYESEYLFEYRNGLSSSGPELYHFDGDKTMFSLGKYLDFESSRCCKQFVWKGPNYIDY